MKTYLFSVVLFASALPIIASCASAQSNAVGAFKKVGGAPIETTVFNQVYGQVTSRIHPLSAMNLKDSCLFRYREEFLDGDGKPIRDMSQNTTKAFIWTRKASGCEVLTEPMIKIIDFDLSSFKKEKPRFDAFLKGGYEGVPTPPLDALLNGNVSPTAISRKGKSFSFMFATPTGYGEAILDNGSQDKLRLVRFEEWQ